ncbi:MAG TPA: low-specificity L-threonine aldolase [Planctomycetota bacterium]|nr:low-specificity L-threonine aldolase [Planctomycetota bacterium]
MMPERVIDLRSDTVTKPSAGMRQAMAAADVGDDVYGEDPTVNELQARCAKLFGKEAALFVASGTMANQVCIRTHTRPGDEVIVEELAHAYNCECGDIATMSGAQARTIRGRRGAFTGKDVECLIRGENIHFPRTSLVCVENTHNFAGGAVFPLDNIIDISRVAREHGLKMHLDGARLANACVATGIDPDEYARYFDSVTMCFSKGLGAPVGSIIAGSGEFIAWARRTRKMFGGGMRQAGILAAAALYALDNNFDRLEEDHENARLIADALAGIPHVEMDPEGVETNIVVFRVDSAVSVEALLGRLKARGVLLSRIGPNTLRAVTHLDVSLHDAERAADIICESFAASVP